MSETEYCFCIKTLWVNVLPVNNVTACSCLDVCKLFSPFPHLLCPIYTHIHKHCDRQLHTSISPISLCPTVLPLSVYLISYWVSQWKIIMSRQLFYSVRWLETSSNTVCFKFKCVLGVSSRWTLRGYRTSVFRTFDEMQTRKQKLKPEQDHICCRPIMVQVLSLVPFM